MPTTLRTLKKSKLNKSVYRSAGLQCACDREFDSADDELRRVVLKVRDVAASCVRTAIDWTLKFSRSHFEDDDPGFATLLERLQQCSRKGTDYYPSVVAEISNYLGRVDLSKVDFRAETPETHFLASLSILKEAVQAWLSRDYGTCHTATVQCRAGLLRIAS